MSFKYFLIIFGLEISHQMLVNGKSSLNLRMYRIAFYPDVSCSWLRKEGKGLRREIMYLEKTQSCPKENSFLRQFVTSFVRSGAAE